MATTIVASRPDTARTGRPRRKGLRTDTDPLIAYALYNATCSHLCWLPKEVLLRIMKHLDPVGLQCLRRTSRLFLCLFSQQFRILHDHNGLKLMDIVGPPAFFPWARSRRLPGLTYLRTPGPTLLRHLIGKDATSSVCSACQENRAARHAWQRSLLIKRTGNSAWRHCKPCGIDYPPVYFSRIRQCIGRLGHVRLCEHRHCVIGWDTVIRYSKLLATFDLPEPVRATLLVCRHESHLPAHHASSQHATGGEEVAYYYPSITLTGSKSTAMRLYMEWTGHVLLPPVNPSTGKKKLTPTVMTHLLQRFRRGAPTEFIVPQSAPGPLPEMRCFDPNRCQCLYYAGGEERTCRVGGSSRGGRVTTERGTNRAVSHAPAMRAR
ncbi:hypothetical protein B0T24DRAFT_698012 [Lasiosphaeria ovina]|uniref:F-box domain-containing protein n=1 Tax=Lasiosphaeria ovina TaxID=92902 RepID=A0AAE0N9F3_9PEZI|nr:hypothetical protein B0T24DRAFT_698012 [Lasiosphaeria ovina]